jgi:hypothetical protein
MSNKQNPSPIIAYFVKELEPSLPEEAKAKLATYEDSIAKTTHHGDFRRAWHSADWAVTMAQRSSDSHVRHLVASLKEKHELWKDTIFGAEFGAIPGDGIGPGQDAEIQWVDDAVAVAKAEAERTGWDSVPWEDLLKEMLSVSLPKG